MVDSLDDEWWIEKKTLSQVLAEQKPEAVTCSDFIDSVQKHFQDKLSAVEMDEVQLDDSHFMKCASLNCQVADYMRQVLPKWKRLVKVQKQENGAPLVLVICSAASRAVHLNREIQKTFKEKCKVAKLFAKHMKIEEQKKYLDSTVIQMGVGTPHRINALIEEGALKVDQIQHIILDWMWRDQRLRQMISIPEIKEELLELFKKHLFKLVRQKNVTIGLV
ncbi:protein CMSS1 isoform X2 [Lingula anatina]|uniref:Protein CMSS1 isoform X2 n=1 Tax=Lingula anatina TaxID=7574 RepID=A0A1S3K1M6_LINAN|nr:protein CMSS1 isoform X2 [Lingula anatina]|eukprot:XP_013416299.1 protein CMSS1 isoform X2 [Lingula anatina]